MSATQPTPIDPRGHIPWLDWQRGYMRWTCEIDSLTVEVDDIGVVMRSTSGDGEVVLNLTKTVEAIGKHLSGCIRSDISESSQRVVAESYLIRTWRSALRGVSDV